MEWLTLFAAHPSALASFHAWLKEHEDACCAYALDGPEADIPQLKGTRNAYRDIRAYLNNNLVRATTAPRK